MKKKGRLTVHTRRGSKSESTNNGLYPVSSFSALCDYIKLNPGMLRQLRVRPETANKLSEAFGAASLRRVPLEISSDIEGSFEASIALEPLPESVFMDEISDLDSDASELVVALDHSQDPQNLGSVARTCGYYGVRYLLIPKDRQVQLTASSVAISQAGFAVTHLVSVTNLARVIDKLKSVGFWCTGFDMAGEPIDNPSWIAKKSLVILGAEGSGLTQNVERRCDFKVAIPAPGTMRGVESLNVGVAAGVAIHSYFRHLQD